MLNQYMKELEQEPFDADEFVERMVRRSMQESLQEDNQFDPEMIHDIFTQAIQDLKVLQDRQERKCARLQQAVRDEEQLYAARLTDIADQHAECVGVFSKLDERASRCGGGALHVGERLAAARAPRARAAAARGLLAQLAGYLSPAPPAPPAADAAHLPAAAAAVLRLHAVAQDLPERFAEARRRIDADYERVQRALVDEFVRAQTRDDRARMRDLAALAADFRGYSHCVDAFIETAQTNCLTGRDPFAGVVPLCRRAREVIDAVFPNPEQVMSKFVLNVFHVKLQRYAQSRAADRGDLERHLGALHAVVAGVARAADALAGAGLLPRDGGVARDALAAGALAGLAEGAPALELRRLRAALAALQDRHYAERGHVRRAPQPGHLQELRRDLTAVLARAGADERAPTPLLSAPLAARMLAEARTSLTRCAALAGGAGGAGAAALADCALAALLVDHVEYALDAAADAPPARLAPQVYYFDVAKEANEIVKMYEEFFQETVLPCIGSPARQSECIQRKNAVVERLEGKLEAGLERAIDGAVAWARHTLAAEQRRSDFRPDGDVDTVASAACGAVVGALGGALEALRGALPGAAAADELAVRLHRLVYDHLHNYTFNSAGAMVAICDVKEYRSAALRGAPAAAAAGGAPVAELFDALHALCNLLLVKPENLRQVCAGETLAELDRGVLASFIQLRADYKTNKLAALLKGLL